MLGRVDGFDQDEGESKRDERAVILRRLLASKCDTLEAFELADCVIRRKAATDSDGSRPPIPIEAGHPGEAGLKLSMSAIESRTRPPLRPMQGEVRCPPRERRCGRFEKF